MGMNKTELIEKAVELGIDATGTVKQLRDRLEAYRLAPKPVTEAEVRELPARKKYRFSAKFPKGRK
jgi:hypothetical protein